MPRLNTSEEKHFATVFRNAVLHGWGVVDGGTEHERPGVNFAGRYVLVQWGCGSNCMQAALIDGRNGSVLKLPGASSNEQTEFRLATGSSDLRTLRFRWNSELLVIPEIADGKTHHYQLQNERWKQLK